MLHYFLFACKCSTSQGATSDWKKKAIYSVYYFGLVMFAEDVQAWEGIEGNRTTRMTELSVLSSVSHCVKWLVFVSLRRPIANFFFSEVSSADLRHLATYGLQTLAQCSTLAAAGVHAASLCSVFKASLPPDVNLIRVHHLRTSIYLRFSTRLKLLIENKLSSVQTAGVLWNTSAQSQSLKSFLAEWRSHMQLR